MEKLEKLYKIRVYLGILNDKCSKMYVKRVLISNYKKGSIKIHSNKGNMILFFDIRNNIGKINGIPLYVFYSNAKPFFIQDKKEREKIFNELKKSFKEL